MIMYNTEPALIIVSDDLKVSRKRSRSELQRTSSEQAPETKRRRVSIRRTVGFSATVTVMPTTSTSNSNDWIQDSDAIRFRANVKRDVMVLAKYCKENRLKDMDQTEYCSVGVERYCCAPATRNQAKALKEQRVRAVMQQQAAQRAMGVSDPEAIRAVAQQMSKQARDRAVQLAARLC